MRRAGLDIPAAWTERNQLRHVLASSLILNNWLKTLHGWTVGQAWTLSVIIGGHDGVPTDGSIDRGLGRLALLDSRHPERNRPVRDAMSSQLRIGLPCRQQRAPAMRRT